jgi:3-hydroxyacyl-CoA dehydrogenase
MRLQSDVHEGSPFPIRRAAVIGAGTMGSGIAIAFANAGIPVVSIDASPEALQRARATIERAYAGQVEKGRISDVQREERLASIRAETNLDAVADCDVVIEAVFEALDVKREVFAKLGAICRSDAILASNTSTLDVDAIAAAAPHPERSLGLHFFSPAHVMRLLEVVVGNCDGFVGNRMLLRYRREAEFLVLEGATPQAVDAALENFGFAMGIFAVADLAGIDIGYSAKLERIKRDAAPPFTVTDLPDALVAAGRLGQKTGKGYYRYAPGERKGQPDPEVDAIVAAERERLHVVTHPISDDEIIERCVYALVNEGARILEEGIADSPADIDAIWVNGYGFPAARGGPMAYADAVGWPNVLAAIERYAERDPVFWQAAPLVLKRARA